MVWDRGQPKQEAEDGEGPRLCSRTFFKAQLLGKGFISFALPKHHFWVILASQLVGTAFEDFEPKPFVKKKKKTGEGGEVIKKFVLFCVLSRRR